MLVPACKDPAGDSGEDDEDGNNEGNGSVDESDEDRGCCADEDEGHEVSQTRSDRRRNII